MPIIREIAETIELAENMARLLPKVERAGQDAERAQYLFHSAEMPVIDTRKLDLNAVTVLKPNNLHREVDRSIRNFDTIFGQGDAADKQSAQGLLDPEWKPPGAVDRSVRNFDSIFGQGDSADKLSALGSLDPEWKPTAVRTVLDLGDRLPLVEALEKIRPTAGKSYADEVNFSQNYIDGFLHALSENPISSDLRITGVLGTGGDLTLTLRTDNDVALKLSPVMTLRRSIPDPVFDAPVYGYGSIGERLNFYAQPIGNVRGVTGNHVSQVIDKIRERGYFASDLQVSDTPLSLQVALFDRDTKALLIDQGCAEPLYGTVYEGGKLVPHQRQQQNVAGIRDIVNSQNLMGKPLAFAIKTVKSGLEKGNFKPTLDSRWTAFEVTEGLRHFSSSQLRWATTKRLE